MGGNSSAEADRIGNDSEEQTVQWTILLASIFHHSGTKLGTETKGSRLQNRQLQEHLGPLRSEPALRTNRMR